MAHKSRQRVIVIDCQADDLTEASRFWSGALCGQPTIDDNGKYAHVAGTADGRVLLQAVDHPSRVHLDIETDDQAAEATRLEALGATVIGQVKTWTVMEAPTGHRFCLINPQSDDFADGANVWP